MFTTATTTATSVLPQDNDGDDDGCYFSTAPSSPGAFLSPPPTTKSFFFYSAPTSPMHYVLSSVASRSSFSPASSDYAIAAAGSVDFEFSSRVGSAAAVTSADELFLNGQIRPMKLSAHLSRPQINEDDDEDDDHDVDDDDDGGKVRSSRDLRLRNRSQRRRTRSMSPHRSTTPFDWISPTSDDVTGLPPEMMTSDDVENNAEKVENDTVMTSATSASSSRCSSAGRSSKWWLFLKDFLRSKSEGRSNNKFWHNINISFSIDKKSDKKTYQSDKNCYKCDKKNLPK
ncbi:hypothetical protein RND81_05G015900 [Saponaria officinalis]|uniref:Uncharacterized protein n=1 Tax=Saponaria officinalis TaxID=3572 RepID=A0AAW1KUG4_SAPOF